MKVFDTELFAIEQALYLANTWACQQHFLHVWIFAGNQAAIGRIHKPTQHKSINILMSDSHYYIKHLHQRGITTYMHWAPSHCDIVGNDKVDAAAKDGTLNHPLHHN